MTPTLTPEQQRLNDLWEEHLRDEFVTRDTEATLDTMVPDAYVNHVPVMTGGVGREVLRDFYSRHFIPQMPPDAEIVPVSRTIGTDRIADELIFRFTHTVEMEWMLPGVAPTGKRVEIPFVVIIQFRDGKLGPRAHLLGPGIRARSAWSSPPVRLARGGRADRPEGPGSPASLQRAHRADLGRWPSSSSPSLPRDSSPARRST